MSDIANDNLSFPPDEFQIEIVPLPDGGAEMQVILKGETLERVSKLASEHGMTLAEWLKHAPLQK